MIDDDDANLTNDFLSQDDQIIKDKLDEFRRLRIKWVKIANLINVTVRRLERWRERYSYTDPRFTVDNNQLDNIISNHAIGHPNTGIVSMQSKLARENYVVTRERVRSSLKRINPQESENRKRTTTTRRVYNVAGPHHLWHMDGNHKLILFNLVIHGAIDGFSRACVFLSCGDNNESTTVVSLYKGAVTEYGCPSRLRTDH
eukprot:gene7557-10297_t